MINRAVVPIAKPIKMFRSARSSDASGEIGLKRNTPKKHADTINVPRHHASIRYSGQWSLNASSIFISFRNHLPGEIYSLSPFDLKQRVESTKAVILFESVARVLGPARIVDQKLVAIFPRRLTCDLGFPSAIGAAFE